LPATGSAGDATFKSEPAHGDAHEFSVGTPAHVDAAAKAAEEAFWSYGYSSREERAALLNAIADEIEARGAEITAIGTRKPAAGSAPARRARPHHRAVAAVCQPYREGRLSRPPP
jgi:acyl-CoA reductase-like NAD-dependent aldehyde dehydrogenase